MKKNRLPLEDAGVIAVIMYNPTWTLEDRLKTELIEGMIDADARQIAEVLLERKSKTDVPEHVLPVIERITRYKEARGLNRNVARRSGTNGQSATSEIH